MTGALTGGGDLRILFSAVKPKQLASASGGVPWCPQLRKQGQNLSVLPLPCLDNPHVPLELSMKGSSRNSGRVLSSVT